MENTGLWKYCTPEQSLSLIHIYNEAVTYQENAKPFIDYMKEHRISWTAWALGNKEEAHSMIRSSCDKYSGWTSNDLTDFGRLIFSNFK